MIRIVLALVMAAAPGHGACAETRSTAPRLKELVKIGRAHV